MSISFTKNGAIFKNNVGLIVFDYAVSFKTNQQRKNKTIILC